MYRQVYSPEKGCSSKNSGQVANFLKSRFRDFSENDPIQAQIFGLRMKRTPFCAAHYILDPLSN